MARETPYLAPLIKRYVDQVATVLVCYGKVGIEATILDVRSVFGRIEFLIEPIHGQGKAWVRKERVHL